MTAPDMRHWSALPEGGVSAMQDEILSQLHDYVIITDPQGRILFVSPQLLQLGSRRQEDVIGQPFTKLFMARYGADQPPEEILQATLDGGWQGVIETLVDPDAPHILDARSFPIRDTSGEIIAMMGIAEDRTFRHEVLDELSRREQQMRFTFDDAPIGAAVIGLDGRAIRVNSELCRMTGYTREEMEGKSFQDLTHPDDVDMTRAQYDQLIQGKLDQYQMDKRYVCKDGSGLWVSLSVRLVRDRDSQPLYALAMMEDISDRREAQAALRKQEAQMRNATKMEAIGRLAGGIAHDFNNQLTVVKGYAEMLLRELDPDGSQHESVEEIRAAAQRAADLTNQLLVFGRKRALRAEMLDLNQVLREMGGPLARMLGEDIELSTIVDPDLGAVKVDRAQLQQMIVNLVVNARDAMDPPGRITIETANVSIAQHQFAECPLLSAGPYVMLSVADTGEGMDEETRRNVFEPFYTTKPQGEGTGLGLAMVYGLVQSSGGHVEVESNPGEGSVFRVYLPTVRAGEQSGTPAEATPPQASGDGRTVLLVEDEEAVRHVLVRELRLAGYTVLEAADAREAIPLGEHYTEPIDLLVTDVVMPGMKGPQLAEKLLHVRPRMQVLFISGYSEPITLDDNRQVNLLRKPFSPAELTEAVRDALGHHQSAQ
jgi:two-component system, cell cycle sensor histidine kinase and response regulator CckA